MVAGLHRKTYALIDTEAVKANIRQELKWMGEGSVLYAVVKANGYGHGAVKVAEAAREAGAQGFCVALLDEALELREAGFDEPIILLGLADVSYAVKMAEMNISVAVSSLEWLEKAQSLLTASAAVNPLAVHMALDTGMGRIGFRTKSEVENAEQIIQKSDCLYLEGLFTHFAKADDPDDHHFKQQQHLFLNLLETLEEKPAMIHSANSATALWHKHSPSTIIRFGIAMYGLNPSGGVISESYSLKPALQLISELIHVKQMKGGETISYGATYCAKAGEWIGTLPIGYADGWLRGLQGQDVLVEGNRCEIVGRICMDQCMIRLPHEMPAGTKAVLIGKSGNEEVTIQTIADKLNTIHYEVVCGLSERIPRIYT